MSDALGSRNIISYHLPMKHILLAVFCLALSMASAADQKAAPLVNADVAKKLLTSHVWKTPAGTELVFEANGRGHRRYIKDKTSLQWRLLKDSIFEFDAREREKGSLRRWYVRIVSEAEAYYGTNLNQISVRLTAFPKSK